MALLRVPGQLFDFFKDKYGEENRGLYASQTMTFMGDVGEDPTISLDVKEEEGRKRIISTDIYDGGLLVGKGQAEANIISTKLFERMLRRTA
jgi:hypothetical protein